MHNARPAILYYISRFVPFPLCYNLTRLCSIPLSRPLASLPASSAGQIERRQVGRGWRVTGSQYFIIIDI